MKTSIRAMKAQIEEMEKQILETAINILNMSNEPLTAQQILERVASCTGVEMTPQQLRANFKNAGRMSESKKNYREYALGYPEKYASRFECIGQLNLGKEIDEKKCYFVEVDEYGNIVNGGQSIVKVQTITKYFVK